MTPRGISISHHQALAEQAVARRAEIAQAAAEARELRVRLFVAEQVLACRLYYAHEGGFSVDGLAVDAGLTRDETFAAIDRYRQQLA